MSDAERAMVVAEARSWIGTPYHHAADIKGKNGGADCAMLLVRVYCDLGLVEKFDPRPYTRDWFLHRNRSAILASWRARAKYARHWKAILFSFALVVVLPMPGLFRRLIR